jgi:hypothetical protein
MITEKEHRAEPRSASGVKYRFSAAIEPLINYLKITAAVALDQPLAHCGPHRRRIVGIPLRPLKTKCGFRLTLS